MKLLFLLFALATICYSVPIVAQTGQSNFLDIPKAENPEPASLVQTMTTSQTTTTSQTAPNEYFDVGADEVRNTVAIQDSLSYGVSQIINEAVKSKKAPIAEYTVTDVSKVQKQITGGGTNYKFQVALTDNAGTTITASFTCFARDSDQKRVLTAYNYQVQSTRVTQSQPIEPAPNAYTVVSEAEAAADQEIQTCLNYGLNEVLKKAKSDGNTNVDGLSTQVKSVERQIVQGNYAFYRFTVEQKNQAVTLTTTFVVVYNKVVKQANMKSLLYKVESVRTTGVIVTDNDGYSSVPLLDVQSNPVIHDCLEFGVSEVIQKALSERRVPISIYTVTDITEAAKKMVGELTLYKFNVELGNGQGTVIKANFTVKYNTATTKRTIASFSYNATTRTTTTSS